MYLVKHIMCFYDRSVALAPQFHHLFRVLALQLRHLFRAFSLQSRHFVKVHLHRSLDSSTAIMTERFHSLDDDV
jgi:hypothetical protein